MAWTPYQQLVVALLVAIVVMLAYAGYRSRALVQKIDRLMPTVDELLPKAERIVDSVDGVRCGLCGMCAINVFGKKPFSDMCANNPALCEQCPAAAK